MFYIFSQIREYQSIGGNVHNTCTLLSHIITACDEPRKDHKSIALEHSNLQKSILKKMNSGLESSNENKLISLEI